MPGSASDQVGVERADDGGAIDGILDGGIAAERQTRAGRGVMFSGGIPLVPARSGKPSQELVHLRAQGRRAIGLREKPQPVTCASVSRVSVRIAARNADHVRISPSSVNARIDLDRTIEDRACATRRSPRGWRVKRVPLDLGRPPSWLSTSSRLHVRHGSSP